MIKRVSNNTRTFLRICICSKWWRENQSTKYSNERFLCGKQTVTIAYIQLTQKKFNIISSIRYHLRNMISFDCTRPNNCAKNT